MRLGIWLLVSGLLVIVRLEFQLVIAMLESMLWESALAEKEMWVKANSESRCWGIEKWVRL